MNRAGRRCLSVEHLESRQLLASDLHNFLVPQDVNDDNRITSLDALHIINFLNARNPAVAVGTDAPGFLDVTDDGRISALDALHVIHSLNQRSGDSQVPSGNWVRMNSDNSIQAAVRLEHGDSGVELEVRLRGANVDQDHAVYLEDSWIGTIQVDGNGRGQLALQPNSGLVGQLPDLLASGLQVVRLKVDGIGNVDLLNRENQPSGSGQSGNSDRLNASEVFFARLKLDGQIRGEAFSANQGERRFLGVYARGLTPESIVAVRVDGIEVVSLQANRLGVVVGRIDASSIVNFPDIRAGTSIEIGDYSGEFLSLVDRPRPDPPRNIYVSHFRHEGILGSAELILAEGRTVLSLRLGRVSPLSVHGIFIDDVQIAEVHAGRQGVIEFRYDSRRGDSLLAPIPELTRESILRVGTVASARLVKIGPG